MSNIEAIDENPINSIGLETIERDEGKTTTKGFAAEAAALTQFKDVKDALMEVAKLDAERSTAASRPRGGKNSMITTFKIMKVVMETLRESSENGKEMNKLLKKEWKALTEKQSGNNESSYNNAMGNQKWLFLGQAAGFGHHALKFASSADLDLYWGEKIQEWAPNLIDTFKDSEQKKTLNFLQKGVGIVCTGLQNKETVKDLINSYEKMAPQISSGGNQLASSWTQAEQYNLGIKEAIFQHEVQTHTSEYQNGSQQQTSDNQAVDNAADTAKQLIRVQGEIMMGKAG